MEPRRRPSRVAAEALAGPGLGARGGAARSTSTVITHEYPVLHEAVAAVRRGGGARLSPRERLRARAAATRAAGELSRGPAPHRLLEPGRARVVVGRASLARGARRRRLVARRRRGAARRRDAPRRRRRAAAQPLRSLPPPGVRGGRGRGPARRARVPALPLRRGRGCSASAPRCWSGDINNDFATLEAQLPLGLNTGLSGVPYWGTDVGGFFHPIAETGELYARWFQLGAFCPVFRSHGWVWREHVPWAHGAEVEAICRAYAELRYRLLPVHLHARVAGAHAGAPADAPAGAELSGRSARVVARPRVPLGRRPARRAGHARGRDRVAGLSSGGRLVRLLDGRSATTARAASRSTRRSSGCRCTCARARSCRSARSCSTPASVRSTRSRC